MKLSVTGFLKPDRLALAIAIMVSLIIVCYPITDPDMYWHLAMGREMVNSGRIVQEEIFSFTHFGETFHNHEWLGQIIFYLIWHDLGPYWLFGFKLLVTALVVMILYRIIRNSGGQPLLAGVLCTLAILIGINRYIERPELFSLFNTVLLGYVLYGYAGRRFSAGVLWLIPPLMVVWDWLHGAMYGLVFLTLFVIGENLKYSFSTLRHTNVLAKDLLKHLNLCFSASIVAMLVNPFGLLTYGVFVDLAQGKAGTDMVWEFMPTSWRENPGTYILITWTFLLLFRNIRKLDVTSLLLAVTFSYLSLRYNRATAFGAIVLAPIVSSQIHSAMRYTINHLETRLHIASVALAAIFVLGFGYSIKFNAGWSGYPRDFGYKLLDDNYPAGSVRFVKAVGLTGNLYNNGDDGGYLAFYLAPERKIFRYNMPLFGSHTYLFEHPEEIRKWNFNYAIHKYPTEANFLSPQRGWAWIYHEHRALLAIRRSPENQALIDEYEIRYFSPSLTNEEYFSLARDPQKLPRLVFEMGVYLAYRDDDRISGVWTELLGRHPDLLIQPRISELLQQSLNYNQTPALVQLSRQQVH